MKEIKDGTLKVGGNKLKVWFGKKLENIAKTISEWGNNMIATNKPIVVTNPSAKLVNPFTLLINFTVDNTHKYQIILQGNYKEKYKQSEDGIPDIEENDLLMIISDSQNIWFKKEI
jgi:hypothetical protein